MSEALLKEILSGVNDLKEEMTEVNTRLDRIETRLDHLEERMDRIEERMDRIEVRMDRIEERMDRAEMRLDQVEVEQQQMKQAIFETNENVKLLLKTQKNQQHIIELLSVRSIEQEAALKQAN